MILPAPVDLEDPDTWPEPVVQFTESWADRLRGSTEFTSDLGVPLDLRDAFADAIGSNKLIALHATRLLDSEVESIRTEGLRQLTPRLVEDRINSAYRQGLLADAERDRCRSRNVFAINNQQGRENQVCLVVGRAILDHEIGLGLHPFLGGWGGEAMNGWPGPDQDPLLRRLGRPAVVAIALDWVKASPRTFSAPELAKVFVGKALGLEDAFGELYVRADIPAADIIDIWQPGHPDYDIHIGLPQS